MLGSYLILRIVFQRIVIRNNSKIKFCSVEDDVLYGVFNKGSGNEEGTPSQRSALCVYSIALIEKIFLENIEMCFKGETYKVNFQFFVISF